MCKYIFSAILALLFMMTLTPEASAQKSRPSVSGTEVTGTFRMSFQGKKYKGLSNDMLISALGGGKLRVAFDLIYPFTLRNGEISVNMGQMEGIATIKGDTATLASDEFGPCKITIKFVRPGEVKVTQDGSDADCGFGHNVFAGGSYRKVSGKKPNFEGNEGR
ncbi:MAG: hypothetical protein WBO10_01345 [Pyrinomonadaceae bacterium]